MVLESFVVVVVVIVAHALYDINYMEFIRARNLACKKEPTKKKPPSKYRLSFVWCEEIQSIQVNHSQHTEYRTALNSLLLEEYEMRWLKTIYIDLGSCFTVF